MITGSAKLTCLRKGDYLLGIEGKVHEKKIEELGLKPLIWEHIRARIVFPKDLKELMTTLKNMKFFCRELFLLQLLM